MMIEVKQQDDVCLLRIDGPFITGADPEYLSARAEILKQFSPRKVLVDLHQVPSIGSTGIAFIVGIFSSVRVKAGQLVLVGMQPRVQEVFRLTGLTTIIPSAPDVPSGITVLHAGSFGAGAAEPRS